MARINDNEMVNVIEVNQPGSIRRLRYLLSLVMFLIVTSDTQIKSCLFTMLFNVPHESNNPLIYDWDTEIIDSTLFAINCVSALAPILGAIFINRYGLYTILLISVTFTSILIIVTPWASSIGKWQAVCLIMFNQTISGGIILPAVLTFLGIWVPVNERTRLGMFIYTGTYFGTLISYQSDNFSENNYYGSAWMCYLSSYLSMISAVLWYVFGSNSPSDCKMVTKQEKAHIEASLKTNDTKKRNKTPWKAILTSKPLYALIFAHIGANWGFDTIVITMSIYINFIFEENSGFHNYFVYINAIVFALLISWAADYLQNNNYLSNTSVRKISYTIGSWGAALIFIPLIYIPLDYQKTIALIHILFMGLDAIITCGYFVNHVDLSPRYAGILYGFASALSFCVTFFAPNVNYKLINGTMIHESEWNYVYIITACMYLGGSILFICFGSGERQSWDCINLKKKESEDGEASIELVERNDRINIAE